MKGLTSKRQEHVEYIHSTEDDLCDYDVKLHFATVDGLQIISFISEHTEPLVVQMEEAMAHEDFPSEKFVKPCKKATITFSYVLAAFLHHC